MHACISSSSVRTSKLPSRCRARPACRARSQARKLLEMNKALGAENDELKRRLGMMGGGGSGARGGGGGSGRGQVASPFGGSEPPQLVRAAEAARAPSAQQQPCCR